MVDSFKGLSRRDFIRLCGATATIMGVSAVAGCYPSKTIKILKPSGPFNMLDANNIPKFRQALVIPPVMPYSKKNGNVTEYEIAVRQFDQQILPPGMPKTTVWGYGRDGDPLPGPGKKSTFNYPAFTIETRSNQTVRVNWVNRLVNESGNFLPPLTAIDQTIHWADPAMAVAGATAEIQKADPKPYKGPVPIITHVHGAHTSPQSDGYPTAWYLPDAKNIPASYAKQGPRFATARPPQAGAAWFEYPNTQRASTLWYHDHALGITRNNVYSGMAGFWLIRDDVEDALNLPGPAPKLNDPKGKVYHEIPLGIQDKTFNTDGSLFYPDTRAFFDEYKGPYKPDSSVPPIWNPEFFGNAIVVNGQTWPYLEVEPALYRLRILNGCNSRFLILKFDQAGLPFKQIGTEGGLLPNAPIQIDQLLVAPAERADVIVDFSKLKKGDEVIMLNTGPDEPFKGVATPLDPADPKTTGQVMKFKVVGRKSSAKGIVPAALPAIERLTTDLPARELIINEEMAPEEDIPISSHLGTGDRGPLEFFSEITETPRVGDTEIWQIVNLTADAHPIHLHQVMFQVVDRQPMNKDEYKSSMEDSLQKGEDRTPLGELLTGPAVGPQPWEVGWKDTVVANPGEITRIVARFDLAGLYVWHCHVLEHEDNEMMRPYMVNQR
ncbi:MAG: multicopper oxidase [Actinomycetota bacterium]